MIRKLLSIAVLLATILAAKATSNAAEMLQTTDFTRGVVAPWKISESNEINSWSDIKNGELVVHIDQNGQYRWDVQLRHREISIIKGHEYKVHFKLYAKKTQKIFVKVGDSGEPYKVNRVVCQDVWTGAILQLVVP